ncbi:MAG: DMT family transporter [Clostridiaceae bacterium]
MYNSIAALIGALIAIMVVFNGSLSSSLGNYTSIVIIHFIGLVSITFILIIKKSKLKFQKTIPIYLYSAGAIGVFTVLFNNLTFPKLGVSLTLALGLLGQSITSIVIDHFGLLGMKKIKFKKKKFIGIAFITIGVLIMTIY